MKPPAYRTVFTVLTMALFVLASLALCLKAGEPGEKMFEIAAWTFFLLSLPQAVTSGVEKLAGGGGIKGAVKVLMTDEKPAAAEQPK